VSADEKDAVDFSVLVPAYNSEGTLEELYGRLSSTFGTMEKTFEVIFVNDGSSDASLTLLRQLHAESVNVTVIDLAQNSGQARALLTGLPFCNGDVVVTIDDDLQHAPEDIPRLNDHLRQGFDAVIGTYEDREHPRFVKVGSAIFQFMVRRVLDPPASLQWGSFRLIRRGVTDQFQNPDRSFKSVDHAIISVTHNIANTEIRHYPRRTGRSGYGLRNRVMLFSDVLLDPPTMLVKLAVRVGLVGSILAIASAASLYFWDSPSGARLVNWIALLALSLMSGATLLAVRFMARGYEMRLSDTKLRTGHDVIREVLR